MGFNKNSPGSTLLFSEKRILGIDILPESSDSSNKRYYAGYLESNEEQIIYDKLSLPALLKLLWTKEIDYLVIDSLTELGSHSHEVRKFLSRMPPKTKVIIVTRIQSNRTETIQFLARKIGVRVNQKLSPLQTAQVVVKLVKHGIGSVLDAFEDEVLVTITRPRSKGKGGWSQRRFERSLDEIVQQAVRQVEFVLKENDMDYDLYIEKSNFGFRTAKIVVYSQAEKVFSVISPRDYFPARVKLSRKTKSKFSFSPISGTEVSVPLHKGRKLIVGIDPGLTVGIGIVDIEGRFVAVKSIKSATRSEILDYIMQHGTPLIICSDVAPMPKQVEKLAVISNAIKYSPPNELSRTEKRQLTEGKPVKNAHEMDALAAAIKGFKAFRSQIFKVLDKIPSLPRSEKEIIISMVLRGLPLEDAITLSNSLKERREGEKEDIGVEKAEPKTIPFEQYLRLIKYLASVEESISYLQQYQSEILRENEQLREKVKELRNELKRRKSDEIVKTMTSEEVRLKTIRIKDLEDQLTVLKKKLLDAEKRVEEAKQMLWLRHYKNAIPVRVIRKFTNEEIEFAERIQHIEEREVFYFEDVNGGGRSTAELMIMLNPKAIMYGKGEFTEIAKFELFRREIPIFKAPRTGFIYVGEIGVITREALEAGIAKGMKKIAEFERKLTLEKLEAILSEYREQRRELEEDYSKYFEDSQDLETNKNNS